MRINVGKCHSFEEFQIVLRTLDEMQDQDIGVELYKGVLETAKFSPDPLRNITIETARKQLLENNPLFAQRQILENPSLQKPVQITIQRPAAELKQLEQRFSGIIENLKTGSTLDRDFVSIRTSDGKILKVPLAVLPQYFSVAATWDKEARSLDIDSGTVNLFLDYQCGVPINKKITVYQLIELHRLADYFGANSLYDETLCLMINSTDNPAEMSIILPWIVSAMLANHIGKADPTDVIYHLLSLHNETIPPWLRNRILEQLKSAAAENNIAACYHLGVCFLEGIGTIKDPMKGSEYINQAAEAHYPLAEFYLREKVNYPEKKMSRDDFLISFAPLMVRLEESFHDIPKFHKLLFKYHNLTWQVREYLENVSPEDPKYSAALFHLAIFYQERFGEWSGTPLDTLKVLRTLAQAAELDYLPAQNYLSQHVNKKTILEVYNVAEKLTPDRAIYRHSLDQLFEDLLTPNPPLYTAEDFYKRLNTSDRKTQQQFERKLTEMSESPEPLKASIAKFHLAKFYQEGIGGPKKERIAVGLLRESAQLFEGCRKMLPNMTAPALAKEELATKNHNAHQMSLHQSLLRLRRSSEEMVTIPLEKEGAEGLEEETLQIPRAFLPTNFDLKTFKKLDTATQKLFVDFQYGLGIPPETPFKALVELYQLALHYDIQNLLNASSDLITQSFTSSTPRELFLELFDLVLLEEKPSLYESSLIPFFLKLLPNEPKRTQEAFVEKLKPLASRQDAVAQNFLGFCLENGCGIEQNEKKALENYERAERNGNILAQYNLGRLCQDKTQAFNYFKLAADHRLSTAEDRVGSCLFNGTGIPQDLVGAAVYYWRAANQGNSSGQYHLGMCYFNAKGVDEDQAKALKLFQLCVDQGDPQGLHGLGLCSETNCLEYLEEGRELGNLDCLFELGKCYFYGSYGILRNKGKGFLLYKEAADQGHAAAQYRVGQCYEQGHGVAKAPKLAYEYYHMIPSYHLNQYPAAALFLGQCYKNGFIKQDGSVIKPDLKEAFDFFKIAEGSSSANNELGICYEHGYGVEKNEDLARDHYTQALSKDEDFPEAHYFLGLHSKDPEGALYHLQTAAALGFKPAIDKLAEQAE